MSRRIARSPRHPLARARGLLGPPGAHRHAGCGRRRRRCSSTASGATTRGHDRLAPGPGVLRPGPAARLRLQPHRGRARVPRGGAPRSERARCATGASRSRTARTTTARPTPSARRRPSRRSSEAVRWRTGRRRASARPSRRSRSATRPTPAADRAALDRAYADAMREVARRFPDDLDAATLFADALMNLRPGTSGSRTAAAARDRGDRRDARARARGEPGHPGAQPPLHPRGRGRPRPAARRGGRRPPARAHARRRPPRPHAVAHLLPRSAATPTPSTSTCARSRPTARTSRARAERDLPRCSTTRTTSTSSGRRPAWRGGAPRRCGPRASSPRPRRRPMLREMPDMETAPAAPHLRPGPLRPLGGDPRASRRRPRASRTSTGAWRYARGLAFAATGRRDEAEASWPRSARSPRACRAERTLAGFFKTKDMLELAEDVLAGEIAARRARPTRRSGTCSPPWREQDGHWFTEPPPWYFPVRQSLGAALLPAGRAGRRRRSTGRTSAESRRTAGRSSGSPGACARRARRPRPPRSRRASGRPGRAPT